nr:hypothetical protein BaRGS_008617 [Batillaria attramentaria]
MTDYMRPSACDSFDKDGDDDDDESDDSGGELRQREHVLLAGSPKLDRSKGRGQTNVDHLSKRLNGFA